MLLSRDFTKNYGNKLDVYKENDLSIVPSEDAPCISVLVQDTSIYANRDELQ